MATVRVWVKKRISLGHLNFRQREMFELGTVGVAAVKNRLAAAQNAQDAPARPLTRRYAILKTRLGHGNRRTLSFSGDMLRNLQVRTVSENRARAGLSTRKGRIKAAANQRREAWLVFSAQNRAAVVRAAGRMFLGMARRLLRGGGIGGV